MPEKVNSVFGVNNNVKKQKKKTFKKVMIYINSIFNFQFQISNFTSKFKNSLKFQKIFNKKSLRSCLKIVKKSASKLLKVIEEKRTINIFL